MNKSPPFSPQYVRWWQEMIVTVKDQTELYPPAVLPELAVKEFKVLPDEEKPRQRKKASLAPNGAKPAAVITLPPERISKLWNVMCGGQLVIELNEDTNEIQCHISRTSLDSLIEGMIDRL